MPFVGLILDAYRSRRWRRLFATGSVQSGKTLTTMILPAAYHLFELQEDVILGAPDIDLAQAVYKERLLPALELTRYRDWLPRKGAGSRGGVGKSLAFGNGVRLRFMGAGGGDAQRSSHTARVIVATELDKMDEPGEVSRETDPVTQMEARSRAYGSRAVIYGECTISVPGGRIEREIEQIGTGTRVYLRCPHCGHWAYPVREHFKGWQEAETVIAARREGAYSCESCGTMWTEPERRQAMADPRLVHRGQEVAPDGAVTGPEPETLTFGVRWNAMHTPMVSMADIAEQEWTAAQIESPEAEKQMCQFVWTLPYVPPFDAKRITYRLLASHAMDYPFDPMATSKMRQGQKQHPLPTGVVWTAGQIDVQKRWAYWLVLGWDEHLTCWHLAWGVEDYTPADSGVEPTSRHVIDGLNAIRDERMAGYNVKTIWVDTGYKHESAPRHIVREWCHRSGSHVHALVGRAGYSWGQLTGTSRKLPATVPDYIQVRRQSHSDMLWFLRVDELKAEIHSRLFRANNERGAWYFPHEVADAERAGRSTVADNPGWIFRHYVRGLASETKQSRGVLSRVWAVGSGHDLADCAVYGLAGAMVHAAQLKRGAVAPTRPDYREASDRRQNRWKIGR